MLLYLIWQLKNGEIKNLNINGNIRDYTDILHLVLLSNIEVLNDSMIDDNISQKERIEKLNQTARRQLEILICDKNIIDSEYRWK